MLTFTRPFTTLHLALPLHSLQGSNGICAAEVDCPTDQIRVPRLPLGICMQQIQVQAGPLQLFLNAPFASPSRPPPNVEPGAIVHPEVASLGRFATISSGANIGPACVIGPLALVGTNVMVGSNVLIGANAVIGQGSVIGDNAIIDDGVQIGTNTTIAGGVSIGALSQIGSLVQMGLNSRLGANAVVGNGAQVGNNVVAENDVTIGSGATVSNGLFLVRGSQVGPLVQWGDDIFICELPNGTNQAMTCADCEAQEGTVVGRLNETNVVVKAVPTVIKEVTPLVWNPTNPPAGLTNLQNDVNNAGGTTTNAIKNRKYVKDTYDCDDFARDLELALEALGYDATFSVYWHVVPNPAWRWWKDEKITPKFITKAHALTDVHTDEGIIWIEPQTGKIGVDLDFDGDGKVEYDSKHPGGFTDNDGRIEVYDSRAAAEAAGVVMD